MPLVVQTLVNCRQSWQSWQKSDTVWGHLAQRTFLFRKSWFLFALFIFIAGQSILKHLNEGENSDTERLLVFEENRRRDRKWRRQPEGRVNLVSVQRLFGDSWDSSHMFFL